MTPAVNTERVSSFTLPDRIVVGLGHMGAGMATSLVRAGHRVLGVDPGPVPTPAGVERTTLPEALTEAQAPVLVLSLPGTEQVDQLLPDLEHAPSPVLVIDASTCPPADARRRAAWLAGHGHVLVDAPVSGGPSGAADGALTVFLGCSEEHLERVLDALDPLATHVNHVGEVGAGNTAKLMNNLLCGVHLSAAQALHGAAEASGVEVERLLAAVNTASGRSAVTEMNLPRWVLSGSFDSGFPAGLMARDVGLAADMAEELGVSSPLVGAAREMWDRLLEQIGPTEDFNKMVTTR
ncbi:NAD(P)-dependent oxidoreductase [Brachybacterium sp. AOP35-5H-19]|uniref:NAD(P)-dependent oxidoreductase n=1 Tax=Brachybacterium sp. AOP35-5H-19 TaxID=3457685 RepID=UPI004034D5DC